MPHFRGDEIDHLGDLGGHGGGGQDDDLEPEFLTSAQKLKVELGDTVVLPCKVANLGECLHHTNSFCDANI